jgi:hypothetical protein
MTLRARIDIVALARAVALSFRGAFSLVLIGKDQCALYLRLRHVKAVQ